MDIFSIIKAVILGIVEGATEFIPVSSTGHLIIVQNWLDFTGKKEFAFSIFIQLGAILAVVWLYRKKLFSVAIHWPTDSKARQLIINLILGTLPAVIIGLPTEEWIEAHFFKPFPVALALVLGGVAILIIERFYKSPKVADVDDISWQTALMIGIIQVLSILFPGVSRSGATIMGGLILGLSRTAATEFSFFLAIPAICGASILKLIGAYEIITWGDLPLFSVGFIVSCVSALLVIKGFLAFISQKSFNAFAWYRIIFGIFLLILYWKSVVYF
jgi:undecaprenyl-diphosphatase